METVDRNTQASIDKDTNFIDQVISHIEDGYIDEAIDMLGDWRSELTSLIDNHG